MCKYCSLDELLQDASVRAAVCDGDWLPMTLTEIINSESSEMQMLSILRRIPVGSITPPVHLLRDLIGGDGCV